MKGIKPKQSLGQNFLVDENIARKIVHSLALKEKDVLIEIGPGQGALTKHLINEPGTLIAYEVDTRVVDILVERFQSPSVNIVHQDFLQADLMSLSSKYRTPLRIVGNIPYHLTSEILFKIIENRTAVSDATIMIQSEVADRLIASPNTKEYGILSVISSLYGKTTKLFTVSPKCFYPQPNVMSAVIRFSLYDTLPFTVNERLFKTIVKTAFGKRRKMLRNSLSYLPFEESKVVRILERTGQWSTLRPEDLTIEHFVQLTSTVEQILHDEHRPE